MELWDADEGDMVTGGETISVHESTGSELCLCTYIHTVDSTAAYVCVSAGNAISL